MKSMFLYQLLEEMRFIQPGAIKIDDVNQAAILLTKGPT